MMRERIALAFALVASACVVSDCATIREKDSLNELQESVDGYNEAFRWKNYERAAQFLPADLRARFLATYDDDSDSLHVEDYQIVELKLENDASARVRVRMRYMMLPSVTIERVALIQHWKRIQASWLLESEENSLRSLVSDEKQQERNPAPLRKEEGWNTEEEPSSEGSSEAIR